MGRRSVSQLNSYTSCGERYRIERTIPDDLPVTHAAWTSLGTAIHEAYEHWEVVRNRVGDLSELFERFYDADIAKYLELAPDLSLWQKTPRTGTVERDIELRREAGVKQAVALQQSCEQSTWVPWTLPNGQKAVEVPFECTLGSVTVRGQVDLLKEWPDGQVTACDWKTGNKSHPKFRQLGVYRHGMIQEYGVGIDFGEFWFTKDGSSSGFVDLARYTYGYLKDQYEALDRGIDAHIYLANPGSQCELCSAKPWCREMGPAKAV